MNSQETPGNAFGSYSELRANAVAEFERLSAEVASMQQQIDALVRLISALDDYAIAAPSGAGSDVSSDQRAARGRAPQPETIRPYRVVRRASTLAPQTRSLRGQILRVLRSNHVNVWTVEAIIENLEAQGVDLSRWTAKEATVRKVLRQLIEDDRAVRVPIDGRTNGYRARAVSAANASAPGATGAEENEGSNRDSS